MTEPVRFAVDRMLGRLARWLRILGYDVAYGPHLGGRTLVDCARRERRLLLTRDTRLLRTCDLPPHVFVASDRFRDQLRQLAATVRLDAGEVLSRCLDCNLLLEDLSRDAAHDRVPVFVWQTTARFLTCPRCRRVYWPATHRAHVLEELAALGIAAGGRRAG